LTQKQQSFLSKLHNPSLDTEVKGRIIPDMPERSEGLTPDMLEVPSAAEAFEVDAAPEDVDPEVCHSRYRVICIQPDNMPATGKAVLRCRDERCGSHINKGVKVGVGLYLSDLTEERIGEALRERARESVLIYTCGAWKDNQSRGYDQEIPDEVLPQSLRRKQ